MVVYLENVAAQAVKQRFRCADHTTLFRDASLSQRGSTCMYCANKQDQQNALEACQPAPEKRVERFAFCKDTSSYCRVVGWRRCRHMQSQRSGWTFQNITGFDPKDTGSKVSTFQMCGKIPDSCRRPPAPVGATLIEITLIPDRPTT